MAFHFLVKPDWSLPYLLHKRNRPGDCLLPGQSATNHFNCRNKMRRIEGVPGQTALRMLTMCLYFAHEQSGGTGRQNDVRRGKPIHFGKELPFDVNAFRSTFLNPLSSCRASDRSLVKLSRSSDAPGAKPIPAMSGHTRSIRLYRVCAATSSPWKRK